jgi:hypothetical protein
LFVKLGPHITRPTPEGETWCQYAGAIKELDSHGLLLKHKDHALTVWRMTAHDKGLRHDVSGSWLAQEAINRLGGFVPDVMQIYCEQYNTDPGWHLRVFSEANPIIERYGSVLGFGAFSHGNPSEEVVKTLAKADWAGAKILLLDEYWGNKDFTEWHALRHEKIKQWSQSVGGRMPPVIIGECGRDDVPDEGTGGKAGWLTQAISTEAYTKELDRYDAILYSNDDVVAAFVYATGVWSDFKNFELAEVVKHITGNRWWLPYPQKIQLSKYIKRESGVVPTPVTPVGFSYQPGTGFEALYKRSPKTIGKATSDPKPIGPSGDVFQYTENGILFWNKDTFTQSMFFKADIKS